jgi:GTP:adenosylcobinamide-phosphate guanylyltransferase
MRAQLLIAGGAGTRAAAPLGALYGIRYLARTLEEARTIAENAFVTAFAKASWASKGTASTINNPDDSKLS